MIHWPMPSPFWSSKCPLPAKSSPSYTLNKMFSGMEYPFGQLSSATHPHSFLGIFSLLKHEKLKSPWLRAKTTYQHYSQKTTALYQQLETKLTLPQLKLGHHYRNSGKTIEKFMLTCTWRPWPTKLTKFLKFVLKFPFKTKKKKKNPEDRENRHLINIGMGNFWNLIWISPEPLS